MIYIPEVFYVHCNYWNGNLLPVWTPIYKPGNVLSYLNPSWLSTHSTITLRQFYSCKCNFHLSYKKALEFKSKQTNKCTFNSTALVLTLPNQVKNNALAPLRNANKLTFLLCVPNVPNVPTTCEILKDY